MARATNEPAARSEGQPGVTARTGRTSHAITTRPTSPATPPMVRSAAAIPRDAARGASRVPTARPAI